MWRGLCLWYQSISDASDTKTIIEETALYWIRRCRLVLSIQVLQYLDGVLSPPWQQNRTISFRHFQMMLCCNHSSQSLATKCCFWNRFYPNILGKEHWNSIFLCAWWMVHTPMVLGSSQLQVPVSCSKGWNISPAPCVFQNSTNMPHTVFVTYCPPLKVGPS